MLSIKNINQGDEINQDNISELSSSDIFKIDLNDTKKNDRLHSAYMSEFKSFNVIDKDHVIEDINQDSNHIRVDDILLEKKVFNKLPYLIPLVFIYNLEGLLPNNELIDRIVVALIFFIIFL